MLCLMAITLFHHPFTRASNVVWMLEEVGVDYQLRFVDIMKGAHKEPEVVALNPMGKLPIITDGEEVATESAAIGLYLADRYKPGVLAPAPDAPGRGAYLRWSLFAPSVIEPGAMAKMSKWEFKPSSAGWGTYASMLGAMESAIRGKQFVLGNSFSMADVIFGGTLRYMLQFKLIEHKPTFDEYVERISARPASKRAEAKNEAVMAEHGLNNG